MSYFCLYTRVNGRKCLFYNILCKKAISIFSSVCVTTEIRSPQLCGIRGLSWPVRTPRSTRKKSGSASSADLDPSRTETRKDRTSSRPTASTTLKIPSTPKSTPKISKCAKLCEKTYSIFAVSLQQLYIVLQGLKSDCLFSQRPFGLNSPGVVSELVLG